jgi:hypothetical protein
MKKYNKHYLKKDPASGVVLLEDPKSGELHTIERDPDTGEVFVKNPVPVLGEIAKEDCPLEDHHVRTLNRSWKKTGIFYAPMEVEEEKSDARLALETEATTLNVGFNEKTTDDKLEANINKAKEKALRADLFNQANQLLTDGKIEKAPAKTIKTVDLQTLINNAKEE